MGKTPLKRSDIEFGFECGVDLQLGPGRTTHCSQCDKHIWDVSKLTRAEFEALPQTACVVMTYGDDGVIDFASEPTLASRLRNAAAAGLIGLLLAGCQPPTVESPQQTPKVEQTAEKPIAVDKPKAEIPKTITRAMLLEIHRELYGEYPQADSEGIAAPNLPARTNRSAEFPGGNHRDILQQKRNIRERRKKARPITTMGIIRGDF